MRTRAHVRALRAVHWFQLAAYPLTPLPLARHCPCAQAAVEIDPAELNEVLGRTFNGFLDPPAELLAEVYTSVPQ